ncbi:MAG: RNA-directed DNA polymerase [Candidatus Micrarchaeota archaeon]|nr:RNA-directed DNA polymerase [Candidatus Micrarchaeota archaeon]MDE1859748.1 RNA-directed DNA polymerase [Candidatus Micrarchaeota archaeon]
MPSNLHYGYTLKADIRHYFDTIDQEILLNIIRRKIKDKNVIWLIEVILKNHKTGVSGKGMPIGNLTSQFFANVYLNELDWFVKHKLKVKYYIRYVDDFVILHRNKKMLMELKGEINSFLRHSLEVELHPEKTRIVRLANGITFLGFRIFQKHRLLKKSNSRRIWKRIERLKEKYDQGKLTSEKARLSFDGWFAYASFADTYGLRKRVLERCNQLFPEETHKII